MSNSRQPGCMAMILFGLLWFASYMLLSAMAGWFGFGKEEAYTIALYISLVLLILLILFAICSSIYKGIQEKEKEAKMEQELQKMIVLQAEEERKRKARIAKLEQERQEKKIINRQKKERKEADVKELLKQKTNELKGKIIVNRKEALDIIRPILFKAHKKLDGIEALIIIILGLDNSVVYSEIIFGTGSQVTYSPKKNIFNPAKSNNGCKIILAHNHPDYSYSATPSDEDVESAAHIYLLAKEQGMVLMESLVLCRDEVKSVLKVRRFKEMVTPY